MRSLSKETSHSRGSKTRVIRRKNNRIRVKGVLGDIADGNFAFGGIGEDISSTGVKITQLPEDFYISSQSYRTVISGGGKHYRILIRPCWMKKDHLTRTAEIGFKIIEASWEWEEFVLSRTQH